MKKIAFSIAALLIAGSAIVVSSCAKGGGGNSKKTDAKIEFINAAVNTSALDFYLDTAKENTMPIAYGTIASYQDVASGSYTFKANLDSAGTNIIDTLLNFVTGSDYSIFIVADTTAHYSALVLNDTSVAPPSGMAYIRFVDLVVGSPEYTISLVGSTVSVGNMNFEGYSGFMPVAGGTYSVQFAANGGITSTFQNITLASGKIYTFSVAGHYGQGLTDILSGNL